MDFVNECAQREIELRHELRELLNKAVSGEPLEANHTTRVNHLMSELTKAELVHHKELQRLAKEDAALMARPSGRVPGGWGGDAPAAQGEPESGSPLPALPERTRRALRAFFPAASMSAEDRRQSFAGVVAAALGGQPLHPAVFAASQSEGVPGDGGFMLNVEVSRDIFVRAVEGSIFAAIGAGVQGMTSSEKLVQALDDADETDDLEANLKAAWTREGEAGTNQVMKIRQVHLQANKLAVFAAVPSELQEDGGNFTSQLEAALARAISKRLDRSVLSGTGAGMPMGILNAPARIEVAKETSQAAATFNWQNAVNMFSRLAAGSHERAWWLMSPTLLPSALSMSLPIGTGGSIPAQAFSSNGRGGYMLLGRPVLISSRMKTAGTAGDVMLLDPSQLAIGIRRGITVARSEHVLFSQDALALRATFRGDARPLWEKARTPVEGSVTTSPYITLADRA